MLQLLTNIGLLMTRRGWYGQVRPILTVWGQMGGNGSGKRLGRVSV